MPEFRTYGKTEKNGTWDGLLGMVFNKVYSQDYLITKE